MRALSLLLLFLVSNFSFAAADPACQDNCLRQGGGHKYCAETCRMPGGGVGAGMGAGMGGGLGGGMVDQPGVPANPGFGQLQQQSQPTDPNVYGIVDSKCFKDCTKRGYLAPLCQKKCSF